jgi:hypothetical protein
MCHERAFASPLVGEYLPSAGRQRRAVRPVTGTVCKPCETRTDGRVAAAAADAETAAFRVLRGLTRAYSVLRRSCAGLIRLIRTRAAYPGSVLSRRCSAGHERRDLPSPLQCQQSSVVVFVLEIRTNKRLSRGCDKRCAVRKERQAQRGGLCTTKGVDAPEVAIRFHEE